MTDIAENIQNVLDRLYPNPPVPLDHTNDFTFLVAVVLSAQTTDGKVNEVTRVLFQHADTPEAMAQLDVDFVLNIIRSVGLAPKKAENIVKLSKMLVANFNSRVPTTYEELESLPGVGHKTASVIMSQVHKVPQIAVDTHVHRLALRWGLSKDVKNVDNVQQDLCSIFPEKDWNKLHLQMIYFGREYCTAKLHENSKCPMCSWIHKKEGKPPTTFHQFPVKQHTKGIVYYGDRLSELKADPTLAFHSPHKSDIKLVQVSHRVVVEDGKSAFEDIKLATTVSSKIDQSEKSSILVVPSTNSESISRKRKVDARTISVKEEISAVTSLESTGKIARSKKLL